VGDQGTARSLRQPPAALLGQAPHPHRYGNLALTDPVVDEFTAQKPPYPNRIGLPHCGGPVCGDLAECGVPLGQGRGVEQDRYDVADLCINMYRVLSCFAYQRLTSPLAWTTVALMCAAAGLARKAAIPAISSGFAPPPKTLASWPAGLRELALAGHPYQHRLGRRPAHTC
jgi:hypothetical protein